VKQAIIIRKDLKMPPGKLAAQVAHASLGALLASGDVGANSVAIPLKGPNGPWLTDEFTKVCLMVRSERELLRLKSVAMGKMPLALIKDAGHTFFKEPTYTCLGLGPFWSEEMDKITGELKLYR